MNKSTKAKVFSAIACASIMIALATLILLGFEMHEQVLEWRMNGERAKANALIVSRAIQVGALLATSYISITLSEKLENKKPALPVYDRTLEI